MISGTSIFTPAGIGSRVWVPRENGPVNNPTYYITKVTSMIV